jgi:photosystem II stability/assembly factor-like uncharacterized protein
MKKSHQTASTRRTRVFVFAAALTLSISCDSAVKSTAVLADEIPGPVVLKPIIADLSEGAINSSEVRIEQARDIEGAHFVNASKGWVFGKKALFVTSDAGKNWRLLPQELSEEARFSSIFFVDENRGWLIRNVRLLNREPYASGNSSTILFTTDAGTSWAEQAIFSEGVQIEKLKFVDSDHGIAVGSRSKHPYEEIFVAKTKDGGRTWIDITNKVKAAIGSGGGSTGGRGCDIYWRSLENIYVLTVYGRIFSSSDGGETWKTLVQFQDQRPGGWVSSVAYYHLVMDPKHQIRVLAGATGDEGYWADMVVPADQSKWNSYELPGMPLFDAVSLSENEILASGTELHRVSKERAPLSLGLILYSADSGKSWKRLYRSKTEETFISITRIADNQFYAVSDAGTFLRFEMKNN